MKLTVVLPTINEAGAIAELLLGCLESVGHLAQVNVVVVDDGSTDGTQRIVSNFAEGDGRVHLLERDRAVGGLPGAISAGIAAADGDLVAWLDADGSMPPDVLRLLLAEIVAGADMAIGSRFVPGGGFKGVTGEARHPLAVWRTLRASHDSMTAVVLSRVLNLYLRVVLGEGIRDYTTGFFMARTALVREIGLSGRYGDYCPVLLHRAARKGAVIKEVPYINLPRMSGVSKTGDSIPDYLRRGWPYVTSAVRERIRGQDASQAR